MKKILRIMMLASSIFFMTVPGWAADTSAEIDSIKTEVDVTRNQSDNNNSRIQALEAITQDLQNQIDNIELTPGPQGSEGPQGPEGPQGDSVVAGQMCPEGAAVVGFTNEGTVVCREFITPAECPCWTAESLDALARVIPVQLCFDEYRQTDLHGESDFIADATEDADPGSGNSCELLDVTNGIHILYEYLTQREVYACREILRKSSMWTLNCSP